MKTSVLSFCSLLAVLFSVSAATPVPNMEDALKQAARYPIMAVPLVEKAPTIDGTIADDEWATASVIPDLIYDSNNTAQRSGVAAQHRSRYFLMYTKDALYVAARYDVPEYVGGPATSDVWANQDTADVFLNPLGKFAPGEKWHISGSASGKFWGRDLASAHVAQMDAKKMEYKARILKNGWEMELRIPFDLLEVPTPAAGDVWCANFVAVRRTPIPTVSAWSYLKGWRVGNGKNDGYLVFTDQPVGVRFDRGANEINREGVTLTAPAGAEVVTQLYKRKDRPAPQDPSLLVKLAEMFDNTTVGASNTYGMKYADVLASIMKEFDPVGSAGKATELGEYLLTYQVIQNKMVLAAGSLPMRIEPPVSVAVNSFELEHGLRRFDVDYSTLATLARAKTVKLAVSTAAKPVITQSVEAGKGMSQIELQSKDWLPGDYTVLAEVCDASGTVLGSAKKSFEKKALPDWYTKPEGYEPEVPKPWKPVQASVSGKKTATVNVVGRTYTFAGHPLPVSVLSTPSPLSKAEPPQEPIELLAGPIELTVTVGGKRLDWNTKEFKIESKKPSEVVFASENVAEGLTLKAKTKVEFDGMIRVDFSLASAGQPVKIEKLDLIIPYRKEVAELMSTYRKAPGPGTLLARYLGKLPTNDWKYAVFYTHFIGTNKVGMEWFCDSLKGWRVKKGDEAVEVVHAGDRVNLIYHMVDHEVTLDKPIEIYFGLIATPTKPVPLGWEILRFDQQAYLPSLPGDKLEGGKVATQADTDAWVRRMQYARVKENLMFANSWTGVDWFQYPVQAKPELMARLKKQFDIVHSTGAKICPWGSWFCIPTTIPEWNLWGAEMVVQPMRADLGKSFTACYNSPFTDFLVANFAANARDVGIDGFRHDTIAPQVECSSEYHGCGWRDENGKLWPSQNLFATREYFKRLYRIFHGGVKKDGICYFPLAGPPVNCLDSFIDIHEIGEGSFERGLTLKEGYPQDDVRVRMVGSAYGFATANNLKGAPVTIVERCAALLVAGAWPRFAFAGSPTAEWIGYQRLYPNCWQNTVPVWNAFEWIDYGYTSLWKPYWENSDTLKLTVDGKPEIYGSYYYIPGKKILLIVTNYEQQPVDVMATFDLKKLGFKDGAQLYGEDAITQEPVDVNAGSVKLGVFAQRFRLIKISADKPKFHDQNLGDNLLTAGSFEDFSKVAIKVPMPGQAEPFATQTKSMKRSGDAALQVIKTVKEMQAGSLELPACPVTPGWYVLSGYMRLDQDFLPATETPGGNPRVDYSFLTISVVGDGLQYDPPAEFRAGAGRYPIREKTPGWLRVLIPFQATEKTKQVTVSAVMQGVGTAYVDDLEIRPVK